MKSSEFDRQKHIYKSEAFVELVKDAVRFFNGTPAHPLPLAETFLGTGVYALYYTGQNPIYGKYAELNRLAYNYPIYVGKAVPKGWRQSRISDSAINIHPGRNWAERCNGTPKAEGIILANIDRHFQAIGGQI